MRSPLSPIRTLLTLCLLALGTKATQGAGPVDYERQIKPILKARCYSCHGALKQESKLRLDTKGLMLKGGHAGPVIEPGHADESLIIDRLVEKDAALRMPPEGSPLTDEQIGLIRTWVDAGANSPSNEAPETDPRKHWAFLPPVRPAVPSVPKGAMSVNPIDAFLERDRRAKGVVPLPEARPEVLLRRLYLDLTGLPPTRAELKAYLADPSETAYERTVDRLLASPQYGERWARHWMDVWRYSDWYGRRAVPDVLNSYAQIWRWRDWIVRSLNSDRGYDSMVRAMLAADEITPDDPGEVVATGFIVRNFYRWNYNSWMKDNVEHTGKAFLALTFNCAHCHDHKYDPIKHEDYFALRAVFEPIEIRHDRVAGEPDPGPYPKYDYGKAYGPITSGLVRVFDENLEAKTLFYTRGESRNVVPGKPPIEPGMPGFLGGKSFQVRPVDLPREAAYPGLKAFIRKEELGIRETALATADATLAKARAALSAAQANVARVEKLRPLRIPVVLSPALLAFPDGSSPTPELTSARASLADAKSGLIVEEARRASALSELASIQARIAADDAKASKAPAHAEALGLTAMRIERWAAVDRAAVALAEADKSLAAAMLKGPADLAKAKAQRVGAVSALEAAQLALKAKPAAYTPLSPTYPARSTGRRSALARWITDRTNPLAARVAVNHIWRWHFGTPLVATTHDFGRNGAQPTHPELLDWLAVELMEPSSPGVTPWSMKAIHRQILLSAAYRMHSPAGSAHAVNRKLDRENKLLWHFPVARMEAEGVRDSLLHVAGVLDTTIGGADIDYSQGLISRRRSLYFTHHGEARMPFLETFDVADACDAYKRTTSVVPQQALALVNNDFLLDLSGGLASRLWDEANATPSESEAAFVVAAFESVLSRGPSPRERAIAIDFLAAQSKLIEGESDKASSPAAPPDVRARRDLVHALFSHTDFVTIH